MLEPLGLAAAAVLLLIVATGLFVRQRNYAEAAPHLQECQSCGRPIFHREDVPSRVECCASCWRKVPIADRLRIAMAIRDREPGGAVAELSELATRIINNIRSGHDSTLDGGDGD